MADLQKAPERPCKGWACSLASAASDCARSAGSHSIPQCCRPHLQQVPQCCHPPHDPPVQSCGLVVEAHIIDERSEWRTFSDKVRQLVVSAVDGGYHKASSSSSSSLQASRGHKRATVTGLGLRCTTYFMPPVPLWALLPGLMAPVSPSIGLSQPKPSVAIAMPALCLWWSTNCTLSYLTAYQPAYLPIHPPTYLVP